MSQTKLHSIDDFLGLLKGVKPTGKDQWLALCCGHNDREPSLSIRLTDGKILIKCFAGCELMDILKPLGLEPKDLFLNGREPGKGIGGYITGGEPCEPVNTPPNRIENQLTPPVLTGVNGVSLSALAQAKNLPVDFLKSLGVQDHKYKGQSAIRIPYLNEAGELAAVRFRLSLSSKAQKRFAWRRGDRVMLYGLERLEQIRKMDWLLLVEGESDCWTLWSHNLPTLGIPGKGVWQHDWADYLAGLEVYLWQEPDAEELAFKVLESVPSLRVIQANDAIKDISEAHIQGLNIPSLLKGLKAKAEYAKVLKAQYTNERLTTVYSQAKAVIESQDPLVIIKDAIRGLGYGGDLKPALITYLSATSRLLEMRDGAMPVHLLLTGPSSAGKSYTLSVVKKLLPNDAYHEIDAGSPRIVIYDDAPLEHRALIFGEADSLPAGEDNPAASAIRNLLQDHHLYYSVTTRDPVSSDYGVRVVNKPGPTVLITTSTRSLGTQLMTRLFTLEIPDSKEQISAALETQAALETEDVRSPDNSLIAYQLYLQLKTPIKVIVPYAKGLATAMAQTASAPRILRDFARLLSLIKAVALIRHHRRHFDSEGRIVAELSDYETVRELVNEMYIDSSSGAVNTVRVLVEAVTNLDASRSQDERITNSKLARSLELPVMTISRRAKKAIKQGWLVNREQRKYFPADYAPGEPMPATDGLPLLDVNGLTPVNSRPVNDLSFRNREVNMLTPLTDSEIGTPTSDDSPAPPTIPCSCGYRDYWLTDWNEWLCSRCHPK
jgi:hypothetical protein